MNSPGIFIAIEANGYSQTDAVIKLLTTRLDKIGHQTDYLLFPRRDRASSYYVSQYEAGKYAAPDIANVYIAALLYSLEHFDNSGSINQSKVDGRVVVCQGWTGSNMARLAGAFSEPEQRRGFYTWLDNLEHQIMNIPRTDKIYVLNSGSSGPLDNYYQEIVQLFPRDYSNIDCQREGHELDPATVEDILWKTIESSLASNIAKPAPIQKPSERLKQPSKRLPTQNSLSWDRFVSVQLTQTNKELIIAKFKNPDLKQTYSQGITRLLGAHKNVSAKLIKHLLKSGLDHKSALAESLKVTWAILPVGSLLVVRQDHSLKPNDTSSLIKLDGNYGQSDQQVQLLHHAPINEYSILLDLLYPGASMSEKELAARIDSMPIEEKGSLVVTLLKQVKTNQLDIKSLDSVRYSWEFITSYGLFLFISSLIDKEYTAHQPLSPRLGYDMPKIIDDANLTDDFEESFFASLELFSQLQAGGEESNAQYATLAGHKVRWSATTTPQAVLTLLAGLHSNDSEMQSLRTNVIEQLSLVHPLIAEQLLSSPV